MAWWLVILAGLLEVGWTVGLKYTQGFTKLVPSLLTAGAIALSFLLLSWAVRTLPIGTAYAVWVGIGSFGAIVCGIAFLGEPATFGRLFFLGLLLVALVGLRFTS